MSLHKRVLSPQRQPNSTDGSAAAVPFWQESFLSKKLRQSEKIPQKKWSWKPLYTVPCAYPGAVDAFSPIILPDATRTEAPVHSPVGGTILSTKLQKKNAGNQLIPVIETDLGTFIMSSRDMCMIEHIPELMESGIDSFKIEGRMKSAYYTAVTANTYRMAIDRYLAEPAAYRFDPIWKTELESVSHRDYCTGYYFDDPMKNAQTVENAGYVREKAYIGVVEAFDPITRRASVIQRNKISAEKLPS